MMVLLLKFIFFIVLTEAITELVVKSDLFDSVRVYIYLRKEHSFFNFLYRLTDCGYCFSVWAGWFAALIFCSTGFPILINKYIDWFILGIVLHRMSNVFHYISDIFRNNALQKQDKVKN